MFEFDNDLQPDNTPKNTNQNQDGYYHEYCRLFLANMVLTNQVKQLIQQKNNLKYRLTKYEDDEGLSEFQRNQKAKRFRRNAHQIQRFYKCTIKSCSKSYGSQGSLNQHYKLKHPQIYANLPNVHSSASAGSYRFQQIKQQKQIMTGQYNKDSHSKVNSILRELGEINSFKSFKIQQLKFQNEQNNENKQNICANIQSRFQTKLGNSSQKSQFISLLKKQQSILTEDSNLSLKRSSRTIKKRDFNF